METLKFITQTTNYKDNELSLIAERITHPCSSVKRDLKRGIRTGHRRNWSIRGCERTTVRRRGRERRGGSFAFNQGRSSASHVFGPRVGNYIKKRFWSLTFNGGRWYVSSGVVVQKFNVLITESSTNPVSFLSGFCRGSLSFFPLTSFVFVVDGPYRIT